MKKTLTILALLIAGMLSAQSDTALLNIKQQPIKYDTVPCYILLSKIPMYEHEVSLCYLAVGYEVVSYVEKFDWVYNGKKHIKYLDFDRGEYASDYIQLMSFKR